MEFAVSLQPMQTTSCSILTLRSRGPYSVQGEEEIPARDRGASRDQAVSEQHQIASSKTSVCEIGEFSIDSLERISSPTPGSAWLTYPFSRSAKSRYRSYLPTKSSGGSPMP